MPASAAVSLLEGTPLPGGAPSTSPPAAGKLSRFQARVLTLPEECDLILDGGRGGGKDIGTIFAILRHCEQYGDRARVLYIRRTYKGLADAELNLREVFGATYGPGARYNAAEHVWRLPNGAYVELGQLDSYDAYQKFQGRSMSLLVVSEAQQFPSPALLDLLRSNLRAPYGIPLRSLWLANPGDVGSGWFAKRYVFSAEPWIPTVEPTTGRTFIRCPSTYRDNPFIDQERYAAQLRASAPTNPALVEAWLSGDWTAIAGAFFGAVLNEAATAVPDLDPAVWLAARADQSAMLRRSHEASFRPPFDLSLGLDWGSAAPAVALLLARVTLDFELPAIGRYFKRGSWIALDEVATADPGDPNRGLELPVPAVAALVVAMAERWGAKPKGGADPAIFAQHGHQSGSIGDEFQHCGVHLSPVSNARVAGWERMKTLMAGAASGEGPGFYMSRRCTYLWETLPFLNRDRRNPEDLDTNSADHGADGVRYGISYESPQIEFGKFVF